MRRTTVKIPDDLDDRLRKEAARRDMTVSAVVREALERHLGVRQRTLRGAGRFDVDPDSMSPVARAILDEAFTEAEDPDRDRPPSPS